MISLRYNKSISLFNIFLFNNFIFSYRFSIFNSNIYYYSLTFCSYFHLLKILRSFGLILSLKNLKDFL